MPPCVTTGAWSLPILRADGSALSGTRPTGITVTPAARITFTAAGQISGATPPLIQVGSFRISIDAYSGLVSVQ
jgi:hypothetical protein